MNITAPFDQITVNDARRFVSNLDYCLSSKRFTRMTAGKKSHAGRDLHKILTSPTDFNSYQLGSLQGRIQQIDTPCFSGVKTAWDQFFRSVQDAKPKAIHESYVQLYSTLMDKDERLGDFIDTDLIIFKDDESGALPPNGIKESEVAPMLKKYRRFIHFLQFECQEHVPFDQIKLKRQLQRDVRK